MIIPSINICTYTYLNTKCSLGEIMILNKNLSECPQTLNERKIGTHLSQFVIFAEVNFHGMCFVLFVCF